MYAHKHIRVRACEEHIFFHTRVMTARSVMVAEKVVSSVNTQLIGKRGSKRMTQAETRRQYRATKICSARKVARFDASDESRNDARAVRTEMDAQSERSDSREIYNS